MTPPKTSGNLGTGEVVSSSTSWSLPFNPTRKTLIDAADALLPTLEEKPAKQSGKKSKKFLPRPQLRQKFYKVAGEQHPTRPARLPITFAPLQKAEKAGQPLSMTLSSTDVADMEEHLRRNELMLSHQDWFLGAARVQLESHLQSLEVVPEPLQHALDLLTSGSRAGLDAQTLVTHQVHNWVLRRRDLYLDTLHPHLPADVRLSLRQHSVGDFNLFESADCVKATQRLKDEGVNLMVKKAAASSSSFSKPASSSSRIKPAPKSSSWAAPSATGGSHSQRSTSTSSSAKSFNKKRGGGNGRNSGNNRGGKRR